MDIFIIEGSTTFVLGSRCIEENFLIRKFSAGAPIAEIVNKQAQVSQLPILEGPNNLPLLPKLPLPGICLQMGPKTGRFPYRLNFAKQCAIVIVHFWKVLTESGVQEFEKKRRKGVHVCDAASMTLTQPDSTRKGKLIKADHKADSWFPFLLRVQPRQPLLRLRQAREHFLASSSPTPTCLLWDATP